MMEMANLEPSKIEVIRKVLEEYRDKNQFSDVLWVRNIIEHIGIKEFDRLMFEVHLDRPH
jgi:hypothetical protein